jgi:hypothetical protein
MLNNSVIELESQQEKGAVQNILGDKKGTSRNIRLFLFPMASGS